MAWYSDEEYEYRQDCREKKSVAASAFKQRTHCGKGGCTLPSDFRTKKEIKAMSGACVNYGSIKRPMNWENFKALPDDLKKEYIGYIRDEFDAPDAAVADMFCVHPVTLGKYFRTLGLIRGEKRNGNKKWEKNAFDVWRGRVVELGEVTTDETTDENTDAEAPETPVEPVEAEIDIPVECKGSESDSSSEGHVERKRAIPESGKLTFDGPVDDALEAIKFLLSGASVVLDISWTVNESEA